MSDSNLPKKIPDVLELATLSKNVVSQIMLFINKKRDEKNDDDFAEVLSIQILASYIASLVYRELKEVKDNNTNATQEQLHNASMDAYAAVRGRIQDAVSAGVSGAMATYTGKQLDYYTQIKVVPEPTNKLAC